MIGLKASMIRFAVSLFTVCVLAFQVNAEHSEDDVPRTAIVSAFSPELVILRDALMEPVTVSLNGVEFHQGKLDERDVVLFLSGIGTVNAAMTVQLALDHFDIEHVVFSGIAGGVDPALGIGDVVIADRWGQYLEVVMARPSAEGWAKPPFFEYPFANFGMIFPRAVSVQRAGSDEPETRFWFPVDQSLLTAARRALADLELTPCTKGQDCLDRLPRILIGGAGVSGSAFVDNAEFRAYVFETFNARVLDMESAAVAHVAYANEVPFIAVRSLSDLAGGEPDENGIRVFFGLAAQNAATAVRAILQEIP
ncbi:5'-methylthioadenosine/S-adenosylhomocysteine nucleosidase [Phaeobacter sp.]|uniref:5'-methylthioadenosine/S-adenosylhomocysteine nucleosidase n=1 Tax=Phaeobacter sp. TaxID=1902409 RepID=UPI0025FDE1EA|nr:5'-methylthioadenosine/S-adenosylhomocysteine nucleosidase [Phaeobacter sp.]